MGSLIIIVGVGVFGTLTGFLANAFPTSSSAAEPTSEPQGRRSGRADSA